MSQDNARLILDEAMLSTAGITLAFKSLKDAQAMRFRCYSARKRDRTNSTKVFGADSPRANTSSWDSLIFHLDEDLLTLKITPESSTEPGFTIIDNASGTEVDLQC